MRIDSAIYFKTTSQLNSSHPPLMKWAGGKRRILQHILPHLDAGGRYFEPFVGGGAVFFAHSHSRSIVADMNPDVTNCYRQIRTNVDGLLLCLGSFRNTERDYYKIREWEPQDKIERAARLLYLARLSFNGIYRQNKLGKFNVPYGQKTHLSVMDESHLRGANVLLKHVTIRTGDFQSTAGDAKAGDTIYFDPPYTVAHNNNGFVKYNSRIFSWEDQRRLASFAQELAAKGCRVVVSNADHPSIDELYRPFKRFSIERRSVIAAASVFRKIISEALFVS